MTIKSTKMKLNKDLLKETNIPKRFWHLNVETYFGSATALDTTRRYVHNFSKAYENGVGVLFMGPSPSCKTFLATTILKALLAQGLYCVYYSMDDLFELYISGDSAGDNFLKSFHESNCLVIDNLGVSAKDRMGVRNALEKVITFRSDAGLPYVICSTLESHLEIQENWGVKIADTFARDLRLVECSNVSTTLRGKRDQARLEVFGK